MEVELSRLLVAQTCPPTRWFRGLWTTVNEPTADESCWIARGQLTTHSGRKLIGQPAPDSPESYYRFHHKAD